MNAKCSYKKWYKYKIVIVNDHEYCILEICENINYLYIYMYIVSYKSIATWILQKYMYIIFGANMVGRPSIRILNENFQEQILLIY